MQEQIAKSERTSGAVAGAAEDAEIGVPGANRIVVLMSEDARDLVQVGQIVNGPGGEQLRKRYGAERRMASAAVKIGRLQIQGAQLTEIGLAQGREFVEKLRQRLAFALALLGETIEGDKRLRFAELQNHFCAGHPVGSFAVDQVAYNVKGAPGVFAFVGERPFVRKIAQK